MKNLFFLAIFSLMFTGIASATVCPDNFADVNGTYVQKNSQGVIKKRFRVTGFKSYVQVEKLDLDDGSVVSKRAWVWTGSAPLVFGKANKNQQRLKSATRGNTPPFNLSVEVTDKDCTLIKTLTWEKNRDCWSFVNWILAL